MTRLVFASCVLIGMILCANQSKYVANPSDVKKVSSIVSSGFLAKPEKARNVLVFYKTEGYCHRDSIALGLETFKIISEKTAAFTVDCSEDYSVFKKENIEKYDVVVLLNTTKLNVTKNEFVAQNLISFVKSGKGLAVIHAGADNFYDCDEAASMVGGRFACHPWNANHWWSFNNLAPEHSVSKCFAKKFMANDEIYVHTTPPFDRSKLDILVTLDLDDPRTGDIVKNKKAKKYREDGFYAVSWVRPYGNGRVFYTSFGHDTHAWLDPAVLKHIMNGVQFAIGDLK